MEKVALISAFLSVVIQLPVIYACLGNNNTGKCQAKVLDLAVSSYACTNQSSLATLNVVYRCI